MIDDSYIHMKHDTVQSIMIHDTVIDSTHVLSLQSHRLDSASVKNAS